MPTTAPASSAASAPTSSRPLRAVERYIERLGAHNPTRLALYVFLGTAVVIVGLNLVLNSIAWYGLHVGDIFVELHGMLADLLIIGWFVRWLDSRAERRRRLERYEEEIDDYRGWRSDEAVHRIAGNIKRLNREGTAPTNLRATFLRGANLRDAELRGADVQFADLNRSNLRGADLRGVNMRFARLQDTSLQGAELADARMQEANLSGSNLQGAHLQNANLQGAQLQNANLRGADLQGAYLYSVDLRGADLRFVKNVSADDICQVSTLYGAKLAPEMEQVVKQRCPELLNAPAPAKRGSGG
jgi:hypothetical protein